MACYGQGIMEKSQNKSQQFISNHHHYFIILLLQLKFIFTMDTMQVAR